MATSNWSIPTGKAITGATYIKDTDNNIAATIEDLADWCNNANGTYTDWTTTGLRSDFVDNSTAQTVGGVKTFSSTIVGNVETASSLETARDVSINGDIVASATSFDGSANLVLTAAFRTGMIMMWSGSAASIPSGWFLCDGLNGTPDLTGRAIIGAIAATGTTYSVGDSGDGSIPSHTHTANHSHTGTTSTTGSHTHSYQNRGTTSIAQDLNGAGQTHVSSLANKTTGTSGSHSHTLTINSASVTTSTAGTGTEVIPKFYALCYIMKG